MRKLGLIYLIFNLLMVSSWGEETPDHHEPIARVPLTHVATHVSVEDARVGSPHLRARNAHFSDLREEVTQAWARNLRDGAAYWYKVGKVFDGTGQLCTYATPLLSALAAALKSQHLSIAATAVGVSAVAAHRMGRYAANESASRMGALNRIFIQEGVPPGVVIGEGSSHGSNGD